MCRCVALSLRKEEESVCEIEKRGETGTKGAQPRWEGPLYCVGSHVDECRAIITEIGP
jgi:hypothetical protein